ncbi:MAG: hypothetical protein DBY32_02000 [Phascolarctobacterium sp.]|nr:MAG: hypothetical protein DBY32_02000 [Phascolarctobacterium sp.]
MNYKKWIYTFITGLLLGSFFIATINIIVDPFFHYRKPLPQLFYKLDNERYQNDGILKHFDYDGIIIGTSMTQNFKTTEFNDLFNVKSIKVPFAGAYYKEINDNLEKAFDSGHNVKYVIRGLDYNKLISPKDEMRYALKDYPVYLYNDNIFDDISYIFNGEVVDRSIKMLKNRIKGQDGGITSFDKYSNWGDTYKFGTKYVLKGKKVYNKPANIMSLTQSDKETIKANIEQNVTSLVKKHPETTFYYFFTPYSIVYWAQLYEKGEISKQIEAEKYAMELILKCPNIKLFSFNTMTNITMNLDNYKDSGHYGEWINSLILTYMKENKGLITKENYKNYINAEKLLYLNYNYNNLIEKSDLTED